jgi:hypothetical protein
MVGQFILVVGCVEIYRANHLMPAQIRFPGRFQCIHKLSASERGVYAA